MEAYALGVEVDVRRSGFGQFHMTGLVAGRCLSFAVDGVPGLFVQRLFVTELGGAVAAGIARLLNRQAPPADAADA